MDIEFAVEFVHPAGIEENQRHEDIDGALLCEPETELVAAKPDGVQWLHQDNAEKVGDHEPDHQEGGHKADIRLPVLLSCLIHKGSLRHNEGIDASASAAIVDILSEVHERVAVPAWADAKEPAALGRSAGSNSGPYFNIMSNKTICYVYFGMLLRSINVSKGNRKFARCYLKNRELFPSVKQCRF